MRRRSGFTLVELLMALILFVLVGGALYRVLNVSQRAARTQTERAAMQGGLRTGVQVAISELQELWTDPVTSTSALVDISSNTNLTYYGMRGLGFTCSAPSEVQIRVRRGSYSDARGTNPQQGDRIWVFVDTDDEEDSDDKWVSAVITAAPSAGACDDGGAAILVVIGDLDTESGNVISPAPIRVEEPMELGLVTMDGRDWLGIRRTDGGADLTPLAGPLQTNGLRFDYFDEANNPAATVWGVKSIVMTLQAETDRAANNLTVSSTTQRLTDTEQVRIQLRNGR
jgi:prepilin-type N-terminal cleavage/methylation domain-containing protein